MPQELETLGHAAATYQQDPRIVEAALQAVQGKRPAVPVLVLDDLRYFAADDIAAAIRWLAENDAKKARQKAREASRG